MENGTELIVCTEEQIEKLSIYFELKRYYLSLKNISHTLNIDYFYITPDFFFKITLMFIEAVKSSTSLVLFKVFFNSLYISEQEKNVPNE